MRGREVPGALTHFAQRVHEVVRRIPRGRVASYRQVAGLAGSPLAARQVGAALKRSDGLPWWRVVAFDGSARVGAEQVRRLKGEKVTFTRSGKVDLTRHAWKPTRSTRA